MPLRSLIVDHFWLKLISLVLAILIWLTVRSDLGSGEPTRTFSNRPILLLTDNAEHVAVAANPSQASITVRGPAGLLKELTDQDIHVYVRIHDPRQVNGVLPVHAHVPSGAKVILITPDAATIKPADAR